MIQIYFKQLLFSCFILSLRELLEQVAEFEKAEFTSSNKKVIFGPYLNSHCLASSNCLEHSEAEVRTLKEKHSAQDQNSKVALWIFRQKKSFGSYCEELVFVCGLTRMRAHAHNVPQSACLPPVQALHAGILALSLPSHVTLRRLGLVLLLSQVPSTSQCLRLSLISPVVYSDPSTVCTCRERSGVAWWNMPRWVQECTHT